MSEKSKQVSIHQKMEELIRDLVESDLPLKEVLREFEKIYIETASKKYKGNKTKTAKALGLHRNTLHNLIRTLRIKMM